MVSLKAAISNWPPWYLIYFSSYAQRYIFFFFPLHLYLSVSTEFVYHIYSVVLLLCLLDKKWSHSRRICNYSGAFKRELVPHPALCFLC